jgi:CspA family cold shock protein
MNLLTAFAAFCAGVIVGISTHFVPLDPELSSWLSPVMAALSTVIASMLLLKRPNFNAHANTESANQDRQQGVVKWFNATKGFGFVICEDGKEIFVHFRALKHGGRRSLKDGSRISFVITHGDRGPQASEVIIL